MVMPLLSVGDVAPEFALPAHDGTVVRLTEQKGHFVLLWFYPQADTPG